MTAHLSSERLDWPGKQAHRRVRELLNAAGVIVQPLGAADAELAGALRSLDGGRTLSMGDRCCLRSPFGASLQRCSPPIEHGPSLTFPIAVRLIR